MVTTRRRVAPGSWAKPKARTPSWTLPTWQIPDWDTCVLPFLVNLATRNLWKVGHQFEIDDVIQEGALKYLRIIELHTNQHTGRSYIEPRHFMAMMKTAMARRLVDLAKYTTAYRVTHLQECQLGDVPLAELETGYEVQELPWELEDLAGDDDLLRLFILRVLEEGTVEEFETRAWLEGGWETTRERLARVAGVPVELGELLREKLRLLADELLPPAVQPV